MSISPIPWAEIEAYSRLMNVLILPWEAKALREMDMAVVGWARQKAQTKQEGGVEQEVDESRTMDKGLFRAIFGRGKTKG